MTRNLFRIQWQVWRNSFKTLKTGQQIALFLAAIITVAFVIMATTVFSGIASVAGLSFIQSITSIGLLGAFILILLFGIPQIFNHLFSSRDLELLFTLPIPTKKIFWVKFAASFVGSPLVMGLFLFVPLIGAGITLRLPLLYYPVVFAVSISTVILAVAIAYLINLGFIQIIPANRAKELMTVMTALAGLVIFLIFQIPNLMIGSEVSEADFMSTFHLPDWLPMAWAARAIAEAGVGAPLALMEAGLYTLVAIFFALLDSTLVERGLRHGWIRLSEGSSKKKVKKKASRTTRNPVVMLGIKEWWAIQRDIREWMVFMPAVIFFIIISMQFFINGAEMVSVLSNPSYGWLLAQLLLVFPFMFIIGPLTSSAVAREGVATWILPTLPLSGVQIALGKFWISWLIPVVMFAVAELILGIVFSWNPFLMVLGVLGFALISCGMCGIGIWLGTIGAKYNPDNPQQRLQTGTSFLMMFLSFAYLIVGLFPLAFFLLPTGLAPYLSDIVSQGGGGLLYGLIAFADAVVRLKATSPLLTALIAIAGIIVYSLGITWITLAAAAKRLKYGVNVTIEKGTGKRQLVGK